MDGDTPRQLGWVIMWYPRASWYELAVADRQRLTEGFHRVVQEAKAVGTTLIGSFYCRSQSEYEGVTWWVAPHLDAIETLSDELDRAGLRTHFVTRCLAGTRDDSLFGTPI